MMNEERRKEVFNWFKYFWGKTIKSKIIDTVTVPKLWTKRDPADDLPLEDPTELYKTRGEKSTSMGWNQETSRHTICCQDKELTTF